MSEPTNQRPLISELRERAKELNCVYEIENQLNQSDRPQSEVLQKVVDTLPGGWQHNEVCQARLQVEGQVYKTAGFQPSAWRLEAPVTVQDEEVGILEVCYTEARPPEIIGPFLQEELRLLNSVADRLAHYLMFHRVRHMRRWWDAARADSGSTMPGWKVAVQLMRDTDKALAIRVSRKMVNHLCSAGMVEAQQLMQGIDGEETESGDGNTPLRRLDLDESVLFSDLPFALASKHLTDDEIMLRIQRWIQEDKASFFFKILNSPRSSLPEIANALRRYQHILRDGGGLAPSSLKSLRVMLCQRFLTEQLDFTKIAKEVVKVSDFAELLDRVIMPADSHGKIGGKGAGLLLAYWIMSRPQGDDEAMPSVKMPRTWFVASDAVLDFLDYNDLEDVWEQKYKDISTIRREYPNIVQLFKNSTFPPDLVQGLARALDDLGEKPIIVRSSSLLEDRLGTAFSGKYKSLFLANQGTKEDRLKALLEAIAEIYASLLGPDPIEYRRERGLLEFDEQMGLLIQEVVGTRVGRYFLPAFAGVAFSRNEFRWSPRIKREDGLVRMVPGLGTRAVDRVGEDYPVLLVPGQPNLRANARTDEMLRYSPTMIDVIDIEHNAFATLDIQDLLRECDGKYPLLEKIFSVLSGGLLKPPVALLLDLDKDDLIVTFDGLVGTTPFLRAAGHMLKVLEARLHSPVDVEFAHDGKDFYLLQCRPQSYHHDVAPAPIPKEIDPSRIVFSASRYISNGHMPDITHIVYVDPEAYGALPDRESLLAVGRTVGRLNELLPKRQFILMGPGRWGSRGDIKLGVSVTYADISNTSMLIEVARRQGNYQPDLSFGTHFFQDLVESRIRYLPLFPDEEGCEFNDAFFRDAPNLLPELLPEAASLADVVRVIDVPGQFDGRILRVLLNAELERAVAYISDPDTSAPVGEDLGAYADLEMPSQYWFWRLRMAEKVAQELDPDQYGVAAVYVFGSTKNATAGPGSDIDLLVHFRGNSRQRAELLAWLDGWSRCLSEMNYLRTGYRTEGLLDVHLITDDDITNRTSWACKIGAVTDPARPLPLKRTLAG
jgi:pyruvate,water dikinase